MKNLHVIHVVSFVLFLMLIIGGFSAVNQEVGTIVIYAAKPLNSITDRNTGEASVNYRYFSPTTPYDETVLPENDSNHPIVYLTFDDGPSKRTLEILDILYDYEIPATFFVTGNNVSGDKNIYSRIIEEGHALGNHTYSHKMAEIYRSPKAFMKDFIRLEEFLIKETGSVIDIMRFPGGSSMERASQIAGGYDVIGDIIAALQKRGYDYFDWNIDSLDAVYELTAKEITANVLNSAAQIEGDLVILLHDSPNKKTTVEALPKIIEKLQKEGYVFYALAKNIIDVNHR